MVTTALSGNSLNFLILNIAFALLRLHAKWKLPLIFTGVYHPLP